MDNQRNFLLAAVLSLGVVFAWQALIIQPRIEREREAQRIEAERLAGTSQEVGVQPGAGAGTGVGAGTPSAGTPSAAAGTPGAQSQTAVPGATTAKPTATAARVPLKSRALEGTINLQGARIDDLRLLRYRETVAADSPVIQFLKPQNEEDGFFAEFGWTLDGKAIAGPDTVWSLVGGSALSPDSPITLRHTADNGLVFERKVEMDRDYLFTVTDTVKNTGTGDRVLRPYGRLPRYGEPKTEGIFVLHEGLIGSVAENEVDEIDYSSIKDDKRIRKEPSTSGWMGITDKYWAAALIPGSPFITNYSYYAQGRPFYQSDFIGEPITVAAGGQTVVTNRLFAGAKKVELVDGYEASLNIPLFSNLIDWGWFYFLTKPLFSAMNWVYQMVGNFGVAILIVTVGIKAVFFPLANKSYASMANMKRVQPEMTRIREQFGDDRQAQQKAMMELYKKEKINPAAGCWPVLIQIPVFFALYKVIYVTIEVRHAPFFGWIQDLAAPDPTSIFNLFGLLPYDVPAFLLIGVWPLLMGITMFVQMQMNPAPPDPTQQMIFKWMPVMFTFLLATFPAGLVIYWAWNNFLSILQQGVIMKRQGAKIELWDNLKSMFGGKKQADSGPS
ncbi:MAG: membrane protein insertase YidC [Pseudomonadota bacterium]